MHVCIAGLSVWFCPCVCVCVCDQNTPSADRLLDLCLSISLALCLQWLLKIITAHTCPQIGRCVVTPTRNLEFDGVYWQWLTGRRSLIIFQCCLSVAYSPLISLRWWVHINYAYYSYARQVSVANGLTRTRHTACATECSHTKGVSESTVRCNSRFFSPWTHPFFSERTFKLCRTSMEHIQADQILGSNKTKTCSVIRQQSSPELALPRIRNRQSIRERHFCHHLLRQLPRPRPRPGLVTKYSNAWECF